MTTHRVVSRDEVKLEIIRVFEKRVKYKKPDLSSLNSAHDGREGDWLTKEMGLSVNGLNEPDFKGFEMKKDSKEKTSFGDWSPDEAIFKGPSKLLHRDIFLEIFGARIPKKQIAIHGLEKSFQMYLILMRLAKNWR